MRTYYPNGILSRDKKFYHTRNSVLRASLIILQIVLFAFIAEAKSSWFDYSKSCISVDLEEANGNIERRNSAKLVNLPSSSSSRSLVTTPIGQRDYIGYTEDLPVTFDPLADNGMGVDSDPDGDPIFVQNGWGTFPSNGTAVLNGDGTITYTPNLGYTGSDNFTYFLEDIPTTGPSSVMEVKVTIYYNGSVDNCVIGFDPQSWTEFAPNDDASLGPLALPFTFSLYGTNYTDVYLNNNGNVSFDNPYWWYTPAGFPILTPMVAPFWGDVDTRDWYTNGYQGEVWYLITSNAFYVTWLNVGPYWAGDPAHDGLEDTFTLVMTDGTDPALAPGNNVGFFYGDMGWTTGSASGGAGGFGGSPATVGINAGDGINYVQMGLFDSDTNDYDGPGGNNDGVNWLDDQCLEFDVSSITNFPPVATGFPTNNELNVCLGSTETISVGFTGPEFGETVSIVVDDGGWAGVSVDSNTPGNPSTTDVTFTGDVLGTYTVSYTATDDNAVPETTIIILTVNVIECTCTSAPAITCPADISVNASSGTCEAVIAVPGLSYTNLCMGTTAIDFDGADDYVSIPDIIPDGPFSIEFWFKPPSSTWNGVLYDMSENNPGNGGNQKFFYIEASDSDITWEFEDDSNQAISNNSVAYDFSTIKWYHVVATGAYNSTGPHELYVDGVLVSSTGTNATAKPSTYEAPRLGNYGSAYAVGQNAFGGQMDNFRIYNSQLSLTEVNEVKCGDLTSVPNNLLMNLDFEDGSGSGTATDQSTNTNDGTLVNMDNVNAWVTSDLESSCTTITNDYTGTDDASGTYPEGTTTVTWTVTVGPTLNSTCTQTITVNDVEDPTISCPSDVTSGPDAGLCTASGVGLGTPTTNDNCSVASTTNDAPAAFPLGTTTVTWTVTDGSGNTATCTQAVTVNDTEDPTISCPSNVTVNVDAGICTASGVSLGSATTNDNCSVASTTNDAPAIFPLGTTTVTWTVTDGSGNTATCTQTVTVNDTEDPTISCPSDVTINAASGACDVSGVSLGSPTTSDNCSIASTTNDAPATFVLGTTSVIWTVTDGSGNTATCTQDVTIVPTIDCSSDVTQDNDAGLCEAAVTIPAISLASGPSTCNTINFNDFEAGWGIWNDGGSDARRSNGDAPYASSGSYCIRLRDNSSTSVMSTDNIDLSSYSDIDVSFGYYARSMDDSNEDFWLQISTDGGGSYTTVEEWNLNDEFINDQLYTDAVNISGPFTFNTRLRFRCDASSNNDYVYIDDVLIENCSGCGVSSIVNDFNGTDNASDTYPVGTTTVTWTATYSSGETATCSMDVTINDTEDPTISCPSDVTVSADAGLCTASGVSLGSATTADNCSVASTTNDAPAVFPLGTTTVTWTVTDGSGNTATCSQTVIVNDTEDPTISCPSNVTVNVDAGLCTASGVSLGSATTADNCSVASTTNDAPAVFPLGTTTVTWTVTDGSGNTATCAQTVTVNDTEDPTISCPSNVTVNADAGLCTASGVSLGSPTAADNCSIATTNDAPAVFPLGTTTVTWTVTDGSGNSATCTQTVTVNDTEDPTISCPANVTVNSDSGLCTASGVSLGSATTNDNCSIASTTNDAPAIFPLGTTTVTWTVTDGSGNTATCTQTVTVNDTEDPTISCPSDVTVSADAGICTASGVSLGSVTTNDNCSVASTTNDAPAVFPPGTTTVTWTVTDGSGNTATCTQTVTVNDTEDPTISCPSNVTVNADAGICTASGVSLGSATTNDNCSVASTTNDAPATFPLGTTTVTWTVTDGSGNTATCSQTVTVNDTEDPTISCPANVTVNSDTGICTASGVSLGSPTTADNCSVASTTNDAPVVFPLGTTTVTWTVTDGSGNTATCSQTVTVNDTEDPTISCPANVTVNSDAGLCTASGVSLGSATTADNCSVASTTNDAPAVFPLGTTTVTWTVTDGSGNTATCSQIVTVNDTEDPTISCPSDVTVSADAGICTASGVTLGSATTNDNCSVASTTNDAPAIFPLGTTTVTWTVTDGSGNTATCTQTVTVNDTEYPTIVCAADVTVNSDSGLCTASGVSLGSPTTADNCSVASTTSDAPAIFPLGTTTVTWIVTDGSGNTATCSQTVTVNDTEDPTISCPFNVTVNSDAGICTASGVSLGSVTTNDNCSVASTTNDAPAVFPLGTTTVTWTVTDGSGNIANCSQTVTVNDTEDPTISCPANVTVNADAGICTASGVSLGSATTADNCSVASTTNDAPVVFPLGTTTVTWTVTDGSGNTATCTQTVTVNDTEDPTISCPANVTVSADAGICTASGVTLGSATTNDNCSVASTTNDAPAVFPIGTTTVTWTVTDGSGNTATCSQTVTINDTEDPTISCPANVTVNSDAGLCTASGVSLGSATTNDNCSVASTTNDAPVVFPLGTTTVTWTVTDGSGNTATCSQTVTVNDTEDPTISCPANVTVNSDAGLCTASGVTLGSATTNDNCSVASTTNDAPAIFPIGTTTVTWTVTDGSGNTATCSQTVIVNDTEDPTISCPSNVTVNADAGICTASGVSLGSATTNDNCSVASTTNDAPAIFPLGTTTVTWTVTDGSGNTSTCSQTVIVNDTEDPTISCPSDITVSADAGNCNASSVSLGSPTTADNCSVASVTNDAPTVFPAGTTTVTWIVTDGSGNTATCTQTVTVNDTENPIITCPADINLNEYAGTCDAFNSVSIGSPIVSDNCTIASITSDAPATFSIGTTTVTWTVTDGSGNTATCTQDIIVIELDDVAPTISCPPGITIDLGM